MKNYAYTTLDYPSKDGTILLGINDKGEIVGAEADGNLGFSYDDGIFSTIDVPLGITTGAVGINNAGQIVGNYNSNGTSHGFIEVRGMFTTIEIRRPTLTALKLKTSTTKVILSETIVPMGHVTALFMITASSRR